jgi:hypothetical protein
VLLPFEDAAPGGAINAFVEGSAAAAAPLVRPWAPAYMALAGQAREHGCDRILTGGGGDEGLAVAPEVAADLLRRFDFAGLARMGASLSRSYEQPALGLARDLLWTGGGRLLARRAARATLGRIAPAGLERRRREEWRAATPEWIAPDPALRRSLEDRVIAAWPDPGRSVYEAAARRGLDHPLMGQRAEEMWNESRITGVPLRQPFMDADLVQFMFRTPPELLNANGRTKGLIRGHVAERLPGLGFESQRKIPETRELKQMAHREFKDAWRRLGGPLALAEAGLVDGAGLQRAIDADLSGRPDELLKTYTQDALALEAWLRPRL